MGYWRRVVEKETCEVVAVKTSTGAGRGRTKGRDGLGFKGIRIRRIQHSPHRIYF